LANPEHRLIDSHNHFWKYDPGEYGWIDDSMRLIRRDFLPDDLAREIAGTGISGVVSVQARQTLEETEWLLGLAQGHEFIKGVVGWVPLVSPNVAADLERFSVDRRLKGVRHIVQGEPDDNFVLRDDFNRGVAALEEFGLRYDLLIFERQLPAAIGFVDRHPNQIIILDHIAKPRIGQGAIEPWRRLISDLARRQNVYCKVSGMATEADYGEWTEPRLRPYFDVVLEAFHPRRLMFGSDWPVCLVACDYLRWHTLVSGWISDLTNEERARIMGGTAVEAYGLNV
jgi:L-fuconolactonase